MVNVLASFHPGHGTSDPGSVRHYVSEPVHVALVALAILAVIAVLAAWSFVKERRERRG